MTVSFVTLYDPEVVVPSTEASLDLRFWSRLYEWAIDARPLAANETLQGFMPFVENPPVVPGLSQAEYWEIVKRIVSRVYHGVPTTERLAEPHVEAVYEPRFGSEGNAKRLHADLSSVPLDNGLFVASGEDIWSTDCVQATCGPCSAARVYPLPTPASPVAPFWRAEFVSRRLSVADIEPLAAKMFPAVSFSSEAWSRIGTLSGDPRETARELVKHLGVLNDHAAAIWKSSTQANERRQELAASGVEASPESTKTHKAAKAMAARWFKFGSDDHLCEWHTKLKPNTDRVYFAVENDQVFVGSIIDHLPTP